MSTPDLLAAAVADAERVHRLAHAGNRPARLYVLCSRELYLRLADQVPAGPGHPWTSRLTGLSCYAYPVVPARLDQPVGELGWRIVDEHRGKTACDCEPRTGPAV